MLDNIYDWITYPFASTNTTTMADPEETTLFGEDTENICYSKIIALLEKNKASNTEQSPMLYYIDSFAHDAENLNNKHKGKIYSGRNKEEVLLSANKNGFIEDEIVSFVEMCSELFEPECKMTYQDFINYMCVQAFDVAWFDEDVRPRFTPCEMV